MVRPRSTSRATAAAAAEAEVAASTGNELDEGRSPEELASEGDGLSHGDENIDEREDDGAADEETKQDVDPAMADGDVTMEQEDVPEVSMDDLIPAMPQTEGEARDVPDAMQPPPPQVLAAQKDRTLQEFLEVIDQYAPIIPDAVTDYYLSLAGFQSSDVRIKRLLALAAQKFISDIATDAYQYSRIRSSGAQAGGSGTSSSRRGSGKIVFTMEDLRGALSEMGTELRKPEFYR